MGSLRLFPGEPVEEPGDQSQGYGGDDRGPESLDGETGNKQGSSPQKDHVYQKSADAESNERYREGNELEDRPYEGIYDPDDDRRNHGRVNVRKNESRDDILNHKEREHVYGKPKDQPHNLIMKDSADTCQA